MLAINYVLIPGLNIGVSIWLIIDPRFPLEKDPISSWVVFFFIVCLHRILEFFTVIRRSVVLDAKIFLE